MNNSHTYFRVSKEDAYLFLDKQIYNGITNSMEGGLI